ncbi:hypothetical protein DFH94DRAFT_786500 [Russula ochroleuca]|uniref:Uncharacterized protein n=1 Tax=Russula ochroleuca TaxID=152965 RepID=A0A9P5MPD3_9AGAM|nr:hypothetical protein DFH94DRAFT_786500 [Russula ochroleuca]
MDPIQPTQPSLLSDVSTLSSIYPEQNDLAFQLQAEFLGNIQCNETGVNLSSLHPPHAYTPFHARIRISPPSTPNMPNQFYNLEDLSLTHGQAPTHPNDADILQPASMYDSWGGANRPMEQVAIKNRNALSSPQDIYGVSGPSALPESWSSCTRDCAYDSATREVDTTGTLSESSRSDPGSPQCSVSRSPREQRKKEKDMERKRAQRLYERQKFAKICELLDIPSDPKNKLVHRILVGVEALVRQHKRDSDLRRQLGIDEADITAEHLSINAHSELDGSDTGATPRSWSTSSRESDKQYN